MSKVKVWKDSLSGDELCSDDYPHKEIFDGAGLEVQGKYIKKGDRDVVNLVDEFNLNEAALSKKDFMAWAKKFLVKTREQLAKDQADRVDGFKKGSTKMVKFIMGKFDECQFWTGSSYDLDGSLVVSYVKDNGKDVTFLYFLDALKAVLTFSCVRDGPGWALEVGALSMADEGVCCIDEFRNLAKEEKSALYEAIPAPGGA
ncbi:unnamed protein product [Effrenium voratum]|nr:unnamed protein product [Effrenium voratum]